MKSLRLVSLLLALLPGLALAVTCSDGTIPPSNPDSIYTDHGDGTVTDTRTGLMWKRCSEGQSWSGTGCLNSAKTYIWKSALEEAEASTFANHDDWRLPNLKELRSLVEECRYSPAINDVLFPGTSSSNFWSGSPHTGHGGYAPYSRSAWSVHFNHGFADYDGNRSEGYHVRLVRGGQSSDPLPSSRFALWVAVAGSGYGNVSSSPSGIACYNPVPGTSYLVAPDCAESYSSGTAVVLTATAVNGSTFSGWSGGGCSGTGNCTVSMSAAQTVTASFTAPVVVQLPTAPQMSLTQNGTTVRASWNAVAGATAYTLFYAPYPNAEQIGQIDMGEALEITTALPSGSAFYIAIKARNSAGNSGYSNIDYFVIP